MARMGGVKRALIWGTGIGAGLLGLTFFGGYLLGRSDRQGLDSPTPDTGSGGSQGFSSDISDKLTGVSDSIGNVGQYGGELAHNLYSFGKAGLEVGYRVLLG